MRVTPFAVITRSVLALGGGYLFCWGLASIGIVGLVAAGVSGQEATTAMSLIIFLVFLTAFLWAFAAKKQAPVWATLIGGGALMSAIAWQLQSSVL